MRGRLGSLFLLLQLITDVAAGQQPNAAAKAPDIVSVEVDCLIEIDGHATDCKILDHGEPASFDKAALDHLASGRIRGKPAMRAGVPYPRRHRFNITFINGNGS